MPFSLFQLFCLLSDDQLGSQAADSFSLLMSDSPDVLNRSCHANVRIMYRQRFFTENSAKLVQGFNCAEQGIYRHGMTYYGKLWALACPNSYLIIFVFVFFREEVCISEGLVTHRQ